MAKIKNAFFLGADETGAVVLQVLGDGGGAVPVSQQCGTWERWVKATEAFGVEPGSLIPLELLAAATETGGGERI